MNNEYLGWFGFTWQEKVAASMYKILGNDYKKVMKDFFQPGGYNIKLINNLHGFYLLNGDIRLSKVDLSNLSGHDVKTAEAFIVALKDEAIKGNIDYRLYDPGTKKEMDTAKKDIFVPEAVKTVNKYLNYGVFIIGGIAMIKLFDFLPKARSK